MRTARQRAFVVLTVIVWAALAATPFAPAEPISSLKPSGYVNDFAHVLSPTAVAQMTEIANQLNQKAQAQVVVVTVNALDGETIESYAVDLFKAWGIGNKKADKGVLILYAIQDRRGRVEVGYGLEPILPDGKTGGFQREANPLIKNGDYSGGLLLLTNRIADVIARDANIQITTSQPRPIEPLTSPHETKLSPGAIIAIIIVIIIVLAVPPLRRLLFYMFLFGGGGGGNYRGGGFGGGGFGGGGFGGGGGGFGGFGGGSSGGGGSSIGW